MKECICINSEFTSEQLEIWRKYGVVAPEKDKFLNQTYNDLTILSTHIFNNRKMCSCLCKCGSIKDYILYNVTSGHSKSCGCYSKLYLSVIENKTKYGMLTPYDYIKEDNKLKIKCLCDCGNKCEVLWDSLRKGHRTNCNCKSRNYKSFNHSILNELNPISSYLFGLILTDGCLTKENDLRIYLKDKELIEKLNIKFDSIHDIKSTKNNTIFGIVFRSKQLCDNLRKYGISENKTKIATVHEDLKYNKDFWRGMIDGDGCISFYQKTNRTAIRICGTIDICNSFIEFARSIGIKTNVQVFKHKKVKNFGEVGFAYKNAYLLCKYLYSNISENDIKLERKFKTALEIINYYERERCNML